MNAPDIGASVITACGAAGTVWGVLQNDEGVFVQFGAGGDWFAMAPAAAPSGTAPDPAPPVETP